MAGVVNSLVQQSDATVAVTENRILTGNFAPVVEEVECEDLEVVGALPPELNGTLLRAGPNPINPDVNHHWFTGDGMIHAVELGNGRAISYRNRWVRTDAVEVALGLAAAPGPRLDGQGSGNVNIIAHGDKILALSEQGLPIEMNGQGETIQIYDYEGRLASNMTAHPKIDGQTGELFFFGYDFAPPFLRYHHANKQGELINTVDIELPRPVMMHDFGVTATRVIFMDLPVVLSLEMASQGKSIPFCWSDDHQARLGVMDRNAVSDTTVWIDIEPCFVFHPLNCFDDGSDIVMDVVRFPKLFVDSESDEETAPELVRWRIDVDAKRVTSTLISSVPQEFPRVNPHYECYPHRYGYTLEAGGDLGFGSLLKHDLRDGSTLRHDVGTGCAASEPIFVATGDEEDEGYILSVVYKADTHTSELVVVDARRFEEEPVAKIPLGARVPFGFHGNFVPN